MALVSYSKKLIFFNQIDLTKKKVLWTQQKKKKRKKSVGAYIAYGRVGEKSFFFRLSKDPAERKKNDI